jgi:hypothetical protein
MQMSFLFDIALQFMLVSISHKLAFERKQSLLQVLGRETVVSMTKGSSICNSRPEHSQMHQWINMEGNAFCAKF